MGYFFKNQVILRLRDHLRDRFSLSHIYLKYISDVHIKDNPDYLQALENLQNKGFSLFYLSTVEYKADPEKNQEFEKKKASLDEQTTLVFLDSCAGVSNPLEALNLYYKGEIIFGLNMDPYENGHPLNLNRRRLAPDDKILPLAELILKTHGF